MLELSIYIGAIVSIIGVVGFILHLDETNKLEPIKVKIKEKYNDFKEW